MSIIQYNLQKNGSFWRVTTENGRQIANRVRLASSFWARLRGLIGVRHLPEGEGLLILPCNSIHMFLMWIPLDIIFLDENGEVVALLHNLKPWRISGLYPQAQSVLELPAGTCARIGLCKHEKLVFSQVDP